MQVKPGLLGALWMLVIQQTCRVVVIKFAGTMFRIICVCVFVVRLFSPRCIRSNQRTSAVLLLSGGRRWSTTCSTTRAHCITLSSASCLHSITSVFVDDAELLCEIRHHLVSVVACTWWNFDENYPVLSQGKKKHTICTVGFVPTTQDFRFKCLFLWFESKKK